MSNSIRKQLMIWLMAPLSTLLVVSTICTYLAAQHFANDLYDKLLLNTADSVTGRVRVTGSKATVDLPKGAEEIFRHNFKDDFYYQVFAPYGLKLAGDSGLTAPDDAPAVGEPPLYRDEKVGGKEVRVAVIRMLAPGSPMGSVIIQVAETKNSREDLLQKILLGIMIPQVILLICAVLAVRIGVSKGLLPLEEIRAAIANRSRYDLSPIEQDIAPEEVGTFLMALNELLGKARDDIARQRRFASNAAHQLRTPLAGLKTYADLANKEEDAGKIKELLNQLHGGIDRMTRTVHQLLSLSKAEHALAQSKTHKPVDLNLLVSDATEDIVPESIERDVELDFQASETPAFVDGDSVSLKELTTNLLENAIRYNRPGGLVNISIESRNGRGVQLVIEDDGIGIPEGERSRVFERFYRVTGSDSEVAGSGLGLSIVNEIVKAHNADIKVGDGKDGNGTRVTLLFPESS